MDLPDSCSAVRAALHLFVGADLDEGELDAVRAHLDGCTACGVAAERAREARGVLRAVRDVSDATPAPGLWPGVRAGLAAEGLCAPLSARPGPRAPEPARRWWIGTLAAAAAIVLVVGLSGRGAEQAPEVLPDPVGPSTARAETLENVAPVAHQEPRLVRQPGLRPAHPDEALIDHAVDPWQFLIGTRAGAPSGSNQLTGQR